MLAATATGYDTVQIPWSLTTLSETGQGSGTRRQAETATRISYVLIEGAEHVGRLSPIQVLAATAWDRGATNPGLFLRALKERHGCGLENHNLGSC
jgi:hypothetical protein